jgi:hypothetical membrane protein
MHRGACRAGELVTEVRRLGRVVGLLWPPASGGEATLPAATRGSSKLVSALALAAMAGAVYFFVAVGIEEVLRPMYDPLTHTISELAVGRYGSLQMSAFVVLGVSFLALHHGLWRRVRASLLSRVGLVLLALCAVALFVASAFPTDIEGTPPTLSGTIHDLTATVGYGLMIAAIVLLTAHFRRDPHWRPHFRHSTWLALFGLAALIGMWVTAHSGMLGLTQRLMVVPVLLWVVSTALRLHVVATAPAARWR